MRKVIEQDIYDTRENPQFHNQASVLLKSTKALEIKAIQDAQFEGHCSDKKTYNQDVQARHMIDVARDINND